jgi:hypothetical protein
MGINNDALKKLTMQGSMTSKEAADNLDDRDAELINDLDAQPMFVSEDLRKMVRSNDNMRKAKERNSERSERAIEADNNQQAGKVFDEPLTDEELETWSEDPDEFDIEGIDTRI